MAERRRAEFRAGVRSSLPIVLGYIPIGVAYGACRSLCLRP